jgi:uncharacterized protein involved in high-affinity Fe2+ transport
MSRNVAFALAMLAALWSGQAAAAGRAIGQPIEKNELVLVIRYIQAVTMEGMAGMNHGPQGMGDAHLEAVVYASKNSKNGFQPGEWIPYLDLRYEVIKEGGAWKGSGQLTPMLANDGPHYGANLTLDGAGKYHLVIKVAPPSAAVFPRHTDKETGAADWWAPFTEEFDFTFVGSTGKKGGY